MGIGTMWCCRRSRGECRAGRLSPCWSESPGRRRRRSLYPRRQVRLDFWSDRGNEKQQRSENGREGVGQRWKSLGHGTGWPKSPRWRNKKRGTRHQVHRHFQTIRLHRQNLSRRRQSLCEDRVRGRRRRHPMGWSSPRRTSAGPCKTSTSRTRTTRMAEGVASAWSCSLYALRVLRTLSSYPAVRLYIPGPMVHCSICTALRACAVSIPLQSFVYALGFPSRWLLTVHSFIAFLFFSFFRLFHYLVHYFFIHACTTYLHSWLYWCECDEVHVCKPFLDSRETFSQLIAGFCSQLSLDNMNGLRSLHSRTWLQRAPKLPTVRAKSTSAQTVTPPVEIRLGDTHIPRCQAHFENTLADDLLYLTFNHSSTVHPPIPAVPPQWDMTNPYAKNRPPPSPRGNRPLQAAGLPTTADNLPRLERIVLHTMIKDAITNKSQILGPMMALRAISGQTDYGGGQRAHQGVRVCKSRAASAAFRLREGVPISLKVELRGPQMYEFINTLVEFVFPRLREFRGVTMPPASAAKSSPSAMSGVVAFGLPKEAFALFPQLEVNLDSYPRMCGMHIHFITNLRGKDAQARARALVSGFQIPFVRA